MPVVNGKITNPILAKQTSSVIFELCDQFGREVRGWKSATDETIVGQVAATVDGAGAYTITLTGNVDINPANTRWRRRVLYNPGNGQIPYDDYLVVPTGGGPYQEEDIAQGIVALPVATPSNELDYAEITSDTGTLAVTGLTVVAVPLLVIDVPDSDRPVYLGGRLRCTSSVANANIFAAFGPVGGALVDVRGPFWANVGPTVNASPVTLAPCHRLAPHSASTWQAFVGADASENIIVRSAAAGLSWINAETR